VNVALISHLHLEDLDRTGCQWRGGPGPGGHGVFVAYEGLRVELESFSHELSNAATLLVLTSVCRIEQTYPHTTTSSIMLPHRRATVELSLAPYTSTESSSNRLRSLLYMASSSSLAGSSSCSRR
jgi:hypothetical protein